MKVINDVVDSLDRNNDCLSLLIKSLKIEDYEKMPTEFLILIDNLMSKDETLSENSNAWFKENISLLGEILDIC